MKGNRIRFRYGDENLLRAWIDFAQFLKYIALNGSFSWEPLSLRSIGKGFLYFGQLTASISSSALRRSLRDTQNPIHITATFQNLVLTPRIFHPCKCQTASGYTSPSMTKERSSPNRAFTVSSILSYDSPYPANGVVIHQSTTIRPGSSGLMRQVPDSG